MITGKSFEEYVNNTCGGFSVRYVSDDNPHWDLYITDPVVCDEETLLGTLDVDTLKLEVPGIKYEDDNIFEWIFAGCGIDEEEDDDPVRSIYITLTEKDLLQEILGLIIIELDGHLSYYNSIYDFLREDMEQLKDKSDK